VHESESAAFSAAFIIRINELLGIAGGKGGREGGREAREKRRGEKTGRACSTYYLARRSKTFLVSSSARGRIVCVGSCSLGGVMLCVGGSDGDWRAGALG